jgi:hypothetical protein
MAKTITIRRIGPDMIEYEIIEGRTFHANPTATFAGPHTTSSAPQCHSSSLWRETDDEMIAAFRAQYGDADIIL